MEFPYGRVHQYGWDVTLGIYPDEIKQCFKTSAVCTPGTVRTSFGEAQCLVDITQGADQSTLEALVVESQSIGVDVDVELALGRQANTLFALLLAFMRKNVPAE